MSPVIRAAGREIPAEPGARLSAALAAAGLGVETPCGARGRCRKCAVRFLSEAPAPAAADLEQLTPAELTAGFRLSCQTILTEDVAVAVVPSATADRRKAALGRLTGPVALDPVVELPPAGPALGLALDVGTTTMVGALLDLRTGEERAAEVAPNPQSVHGADLMSRLAYAISGQGAAEELHGLVTDTARRMLERLCRKAGVPPEAVVAATLVGNTAMHHLFVLLSVYDLAVSPFSPTILEGRTFAVAGLPPVYALPLVAGFVGADAVAAALAAGLDETGDTVLLVDIGTNGEMVLAHQGRLWACSAPAGPAFEGGEISQGMRAGPGALESVAFDGADLVTQVIGNVEAKGICGSGLLDAVAALRRAGLLDPLGRIRATGATDAAAARIEAGGKAVRLAPGVRLTQPDIRALQLAKGAIRSGIDLLLHTAGLRPADLHEIQLAGAFGNYLRPEAAVAIGLLPPVALERIRPVGNAAAAGAKLALLSRAARNRAEALARRIEHVELATHPDFEELFLEALNFPKE